MMVRDGAAGAGSGGRLPISVAEGGDTDPGHGSAPVHRASRWRELANRSGCGRCRGE